MSVALNGTPLDKMIESIKFSEAKRVAAKAREERIREDVVRELTRRNAARNMPPPSKVEIDTVVSDRCRKDEVYQFAVGGEQWGYRLTSMYALEELVAQQRVTNKLLGELVAGIAQMNRQLSRITERLSNVSSLV